MSSTGSFEAFLNEISPLLKFLKIFGLKKRDIEIYALLLINGKMTAKQISEITYLPSSKVYDSLSRLLEKGWVLKTSERPSKFEAINIRDLWKELKTELFAKIGYIENSILPIVERIATTQTTLFKIFLLNEDRLWNFIYRVIESEKKSISVAIAHQELIKKELIGKLQEVSNKINVRLLVTESVYDSSQDLLKGFDGKMKKTKEMFGSGFIGNEIILIYKNGDRLYGLWSDHGYFVDLGKVYFEYLWSQAD